MRDPYPNVQQRSLAHRVCAIAGNDVVETGLKTKSARRTLILDQGSVEVLAWHRTIIEQDESLREERVVPEHVFAEKFERPLLPVHISVTVLESNGELASDAPIARHR